MFSLLCFSLMKESEKSLQVTGLKRRHPFRSKTSQTSAAADREESDLLLVLNMTNAFCHPNLDFNIIPRSFQVFCEQLK